MYVSFGISSFVLSVHIHPLVASLAWDVSDAEIGASLYDTRPVLLRLRRAFLPFSRVRYLSAKSRCIVVVRLTGIDALGLEIRRCPLRIGRFPDQHIVFSVL
jgi:hypothetical protein